MGIGKGLPRFQQDEDPGTLEAAACAPGYAHLGQWGWRGRMAPWGARSCLMRVAPHPQLVCPDPSIRPSFPIPTP